MPGLKSIIALISVVAVLIIAVAVYLALNYSKINMTQGLILIALAMMGLFIGIAVILIVARGRLSQK